MQTYPEHLASPRRAASKAARAKHRKMRRAFRGIMPRATARALFHGRRHG